MPIKRFTRFFSQQILPALLGLGSFFVPIFSQAATNDAAISRLINQGALEKARIVLEQGNPSKAERLFFAGRVLKAQGKLEVAINVFRQALQYEAEYINAKRELAHTLMLLERYDTAEQHFQALLSIDQNEHMRDGYRDFLRRIDQNKPIRLSGHFSVLPSTNVNRGTDNTVFDTTLGQFVINPESQEESGVGLQYGLSAYFRHLLDTKSRLSFNWAVSERRYEQKLFNSLIKRFAITYERMENKGDWFISPYYRHTQRNDNADNNAIGLHAGLSYRLDAKKQIIFSTKYENNRFLKQNYRDGKFSAFSTSLNHQVSPTFFISGGTGIVFNATDADHLKYTGYEIFSNLGKKWQGGLFTKFGIKLKRRDFFGIYPLTTHKRRDDFYQVSIETEYSRFDIEGFIPYLSCAYTNNHSNIPFYEYRVMDCQIAVFKSF